MKEPAERRRPLKSGTVINLLLIAISIVGIVVLLLVRGLDGDSETTQATRAAQPPELSIELAPVASGFDKPVLLAADGSGGDYVVEKVGRVTRVRPDGKVGDSLLDIRDRVLDAHERGLLGLAFHPAFAENGRFFVAYSRRDDGATSISEFSIPEEPAAPDEGEEPEEPVPIERTERPLLVIPQPYTTHKGGMLAFDGDGMLLIGTGDGGWAWDPHGHGQDTASLLAKLLRIDVDRGWPYAVPPDNGFADVAGARGEVHAIGLRNPWRFSFDTVSGVIVIADVGQSDWEEVNLLRAGEREVSFGWNEEDGPTCRSDDGCDERHRAPVITYPHVEGETGHCAIVGGDVYRGVAGTLPQGTYLYGDYCSGTIWAVPIEHLLDGDAAPVEVGRLDAALGQIQGFGRDSAAEPYVLTSNGDLWRITAA